MANSPDDFPPSDKGNKPTANQPVEIPPLEPLPPPKDIVGNEEYAQKIAKDLATANAELDQAWKAAEEDQEAAVFKTQLKSAPKPGEEFLAGKNKPDAGMSLDAEDTRRREAEQTAARQARSAEHTARKAKRDEAWQGVLDTVETASAPKPGTEFAEGLSRPDAGMSLDAEDTRRREAEQTAARQARSAEHTARKAKRDEAWQAAEEDQERAVIEARIKAAPKPGEEFLAGKNRPDEGIDLESFDRANKAAANEEYARGLSASMDVADSDRIADDVRNRADAIGAHGQIQEGIDADKARKAAANEEYARGLSANMTESERQAALDAAQRASANNPESYQNIAEIVGAASGKKGSSKKAEKPKPVVAEIAPEIEEKPAGKSRARKAGEVVGKLAKEAKRYGKAAIRGAKGMAQGWKEGEAARLKREEEEPEKYKFTGKTASRRAGEITGAAIRGVKFGVEKIQEYRASRAEKAAQKEAKKEEAVREQERLRQEVEAFKSEKEGGKNEASSERGSERRDSFPWEKYGRGEKLAEKLFGASKLSKESKEQIDNSLQLEIDELKIDLAQKWFEANKSSLEARGIPIKGLSKEAIARLALDPKTGEFSPEVSSYFEGNKEQYKSELLKIENAKALGLEFQKDAVSPESQFLMINHLESRTKDLFMQMRSLESEAGVGNSEKAAEIGKEIDRLFSVRKELLEKATGRDLSREIQEKVSKKFGYSSKAEYMSDKKAIYQSELSTRVRMANLLEERRFNSLSESERAKYKNIADFAEKRQAKFKEMGVSPDQASALDAAGCTVKSRKFLFFETGVIVTTADGQKEVVSRKSLKTRFVAPAEAAYKEYIKNESQKDMERTWRQEEISAVAEGVTTTMEGAVGGTEAAYERLKDRLVAEFAETPVSPKTEKEQTKQDKDFGGDKGEQPKALEFLDDMVSGKFDNLSGDEGNYVEILANISKDYNMGFNAKAFEKVDPATYKKAVKSKVGLFALFANLMSA